MTRHRSSAILLIAAAASALADAGCSKKERSEPSEARARASARQATRPEPEHAAPAAKASPASLGKIQAPKDNPLTPLKVELGHQLFFDARLSVDGSRSCYSCHLNEDGTGGHEPLAIGPGDTHLTRHAPIMWNVAYLPRLYWDGRAGSLEEQARGAWAGPNMAVGEENLEAKAREIEGIAAYKARFDEAFPGDGVTAETIVKAIASYARTLVCDDTAYDRFAAGEQGALTDEQKKGWELFKGRAACTNCHTPPFFSDAYTTQDGAYHNTGVGIADEKKADVDVGRMGVSENPSEWAAFKTPSLRNAGKSAPYFHDGSAATLEEAVRFMASGGHSNERLDPNMQDRKLNDEEIGQIVAFLQSLECGGKLEEPELP